MPKTIKTARGLARFAKAPYASRRKSLPRHSFETRQKALAIFQAGGSYKNCAKTLNIPVYTARDWHRSFLIGTFRAEHGARQQSYTPEQKAEVLRLRKEEGKSYNVISQLTNVTRETVLLCFNTYRAQQQAAEAAAQQAPANDSEMTETGPVGAVAEMTTSGPTA